MARFGEKQSATARPISAKKRRPYFSYRQVCRAAIRQQASVCSSSAVKGPRYVCISRESWTVPVIAVPRFAVSPVRLAGCDAQLHTRLHLEQTLFAGVAMESRVKWASAFRLISRPSTAWSTRVICPCASTAALRSSFAFSLFFLLAWRFHPASTLEDDDARRASAHPPSRGSPCPRRRLPGRLGKLW